MKREKMNDDNGYHVEKGAFLGESKDAVEELERIRNAIDNGEDYIYVDDDGVVYRERNFTEKLDENRIEVFMAKDSF